MSKSMVKIGKILPVGMGIVKETLGLVQTIVRLDQEKKQMDRQFQLAVNEINRRSEIILAALDFEKNRFAENSKLVKYAFEIRNNMILETNRLIERALDLTSDESSRFRLIEQMGKFASETIKENSEILRAFLASECNKAFQINVSAHEKLKFDEKLD